MLTHRLGTQVRKVSDWRGRRILKVNLQHLLWSLTTLLTAYRRHRHLHTNGSRWTKYKVSRFQGWWWGGVLPIESESFRLKEDNPKIFISSMTPYINFCLSGKVPNFYNFDLQAIFILCCKQWICRTCVHVTIHKHQESSGRFWSPKFYSLKTMGGWGGPGVISLHLHFQLQALTTNWQLWPERLLPALATATRWLTVIWLPACWFHNNIKGTNLLSLGEETKRNECMFVPVAEVGRVTIERNIIFYSLYLSTRSNKAQKHAPSFKRKSPLTNSYL